MFAIIKQQPPKAKALASSLFVDDACIGSPNKGTNHGAAEPDRSRLEPAYSLREAAAPRVGGTAALPMEREGKAAGG